MLNYENVKEFVKNHNGMITAKEFKDNDIGFFFINKLINDNIIERVDNGIYNKNYGQKDNLTYSIQDEDGSTTPLKEGELEGIITRAPGEDVSEDGHRITYSVFASEDKISEKDSTNYNIQNLKTVKGSQNCFILL